MVWKKFSIFQGRFLISRSNLDISYPVNISSSFLKIITILNLSINSMPIESVIR